MLSASAVLPPMEEEEDDGTPLAQIQTAFVVVNSFPKRIHGVKVVVQHAGLTSWSGDLEAGHASPVTHGPYTRKVDHWEVRVEYEGVRYTILRGQYNITPESERVHVVVLAPEGVTIVNQDQPIFWRWEQH